MGMDAPHKAQLNKWKQEGFFSPIALVFHTAYACFFPPDINFSYRFCLFRDWIIILFVNLRVFSRSCKPDYCLICSKEHHFSFTCNYYHCQILSNLLNHCATMCLITCLSGDIFSWFGYCIFINKLHILVLSNWKYLNLN